MRINRGKVISLLMALSIALTLLPISAAAAEDSRPEISTNIHKQDYYYFTWGRVINSYLFENENGGLTRVEYLGDKKIIVEDYDSNFTLQGSRSIDFELEIWGGFFAGEDYNFFIFGQANEAEDDDAEVIRVVKYSKEWERLDDASVYGTNTVIPFNYGSLRCAEYNGMLYIRTCHRMYKNEEDGLNHQANMTIVIHENKMEVTYSQYQVAYSGVGYVSHSFNQFVIVDSERRIISVDHGDAFPRSIVLMIWSSLAGSEQFNAGNASECTIQGFLGEIGNNSTGASVGGFAETEDGYVVAYNYVDGFDGPYMDDSASNAYREVYFAYVDKEDHAVTTKSISDAGTATPLLVPAGLDGGYVLWNSSDSSDWWDYSVDDTLYYAAYSADGEVGEVKTAEAPLSDCQPISYKGRIVWYTTNDSSPVFYVLNKNNVAHVRANGSLAPLDANMFQVDTSTETYDGSPKTKAITSDLIEGEDYSVSYSDNTNAGTAAITITGIWPYTGTLTYTFTINKAGREISASAEREQLYVPGSPSGIAVTDNAANDGPVYTYSSSDTTVADVKDGEITPVGIGTATITVNAEATDNYLAGSAAFSVTVSALPEQELSFSESGDLVRTYGDASFSHAAVNRSADGGAVTYSSSDEGVARIDDSGMVTVTGVGTTVLTATAAPVEGRYAQTSVSCTLTVGPRQIAVTGAVIADKVYDGSTVAEVKSVTFDGVVDGDELLPGVDYTATAVFTDATAGEHKAVSVTVTLTNNNYALEDTTYTASATIVKARLPELLAEATVRVEENRTARIDLTTLAGWPKDLTAAKVTADAPEESGVTVTAEGLEITLTSRGTKSAGDTEVVALTLSDMTNYEDAPLTVTVTYTGKSDVTLSGIAVADKVYDGRPAAFTGELLVTDSETGAVIPVTDADTACIWTDADSGEVLEQSPVNAGSYKLTVTVETDDCTGSLELPFTIAKAPLTVRPQDVTVYVGSALPERFSIGFFGLVNNESADDVLTVEGTPEFVLMNGDKELADSGTAGTYTILWRNKDSVVITAANYEVVKTDGTLTVLAYSAPPSVPAPAVYTVTVNEADNVKIAVSAKTAGVGDKITVTVTPDTGYGVREVSVTGSSGRAAAVARTGEGTYEFPMPAEDVTVSAKAEKLPVPFDDVGDTWYTDSVWYVYYHDLMFGASSSGFSPNSTVSRAQVVTVLWRMAGMPRVDYTNVFTDVGRNDWYTQAVLWAADNQIVFGFSDGLFGPNDPVSREQLAAMLYRYAGAVGLNRAVSTRPAGLEDVSPWAVEAMAWCVDRGLILGSDIGLDPQGRTTRAQLAAMIRRFDLMQH